MRTHLISIFKKHYLTIILALIAGSIIVAPQAYFFLFSGEYSGVHMFGSGSEDHYFARINDVYNGHPALGNVFLEDKDKPYLQPPLGEIIVASLGKLLSLNAANMNLLSKFLFPFLIFLLFYALVYQLFNSKKIAILSACISFFAIPFLNPGGPQLLLNLISFPSNFSDYPSTSLKFLVYARPINPQISGLFLLATLHFLFLSLKSIGLSINKKWIIFTGIIWGLSIYVYIYTWSFLAILISLYFLYALYKKNKSSIKVLLGIIFIHSAIAVPYFINFIKANLNSSYADTALRWGLIGGHTAVFSDWLAILFLTVVIVGYKRWKQEMTFLLFMVLALWIAINQQIVTGLVIQQAHYHWYITQLVVGAIVLSMSAVYFLEKIITNRRFVNFGVYCAIAFLFAVGALYQFHSYQNDYKKAVGWQRYGEIFSYLEENYKESKTIWLHNPTMSNWLAGYTKHNVANSDYDIYYLTESDRLIERVFLEYRLRGDEPQKTIELLQEERGYVAHRISGMYYREKLGSLSLIPQDILMELEEGYKNFYDLSFADVFEDLQIDLVVWDTKNEPTLIYEDIPALREVAKVGDGFIIYEI